MVILVGIYGLMGLGYQLVFGQLGALNLAQGALFGVGPTPSALDGAHVMRPVRAARGDLGRGDPGGAGGGTAAAPAVALFRARHAGAAPRWSTFVAVHAESVTGGANGLAGFTATALPRGPILLAMVWICLIACVLLCTPGCSRARWARRRALLREAPLVAATLGIDGGGLAVRGVRRGRCAGRPGRRFSAALSGVVSPEATGFSIMVLCLTLGGGGRCASSDGRGRRRGAGRRPARAAARPAGRVAAGLCRRHARGRAVGARRASPG